MSASKFRKKPVVIEAMLWDGTNTLDVVLWIGSDAFSSAPDALEIATLEGSLKACVGDYVIRGIKGEHYPCKPDIFEATYESVEG